jgi:hypothetical protein
MKKAIFIFCLAAWTLAACGGSPTPAPAVQTEAPLLPTATPAMLYQQVQLSASGNTESGTGPAFTITTQTPQLTGSADARVSAFNTLSASIVQQAVDDFKKQINDLMPLPDLNAPSTFDLRYEQVSAAGNLLSLKYMMEGYVTGMAHPYHVTRSLTYDLEQGKQIGLDALFLPGSDYLMTIANFCATELGTRDIGFDDMFAQGAAPLPDNYQTWNITPEGLLITFNEYQVAPYAAGPQTVVVPYAELKAVIDPQGPLAQYVP